MKTSVRAGFSWIFFNVILFWLISMIGCASSKTQKPILGPVPASSSQSAEAAFIGSDNEVVLPKAEGFFASYEEPNLGAESLRKIREAWCGKIAVEIKALRWKLDPCTGLNWRVGGYSVKGEPLMYAVFGNPNAANTSLIISAVHGDELTPVYLGIKLAHWLKENEKKFSDVRVVLAPVVNPDGLFARPRTRVNARGVDVNRNLATQDWNTRALVAWKRKFRSDPRRFPGKVPNSEPETLFQEELVRQIKPRKILSIHAPLNFLDYDGPTTLSLSKFPKEYVRECLKLRTRLKAVSGGYFPGSLGNFAGQELGIPTLTLELPSGDPGKAERYWQVFSQGIRTMIEYSVSR